MLLSGCMRKPREIPFSFNLTKELRRHLEALAKREDRSMGDILRRMLEDSRKKDKEAA